MTINKNEATELAILGGPLADLLKQSIDSDVSIRLAVQRYDGNHHALGFDHVDVKASYDEDGKLHIDYEDKEFIGPYNTRSGIGELRVVPLKSEDQSSTPVAAR